MQGGGCVRLGKLNGESIKPTALIHSHTQMNGKGRALAAAVASTSLQPLETGMARAHSTQLLRLMVLALFAVVLVFLNGCTQRRSDNPFVSPYSTSAPFGE
jgi:hypothetical protein